MASPGLSFRAEESLVEMPDQLALATDRDRQYHLKRALSRYVEAEAWHLKAVDEGLADIDAGKTINLCSELRSPSANSFYRARATRTK